MKVVIQSEVERARGGFCLRDEVRNPILNSEIKDTSKITSL